MQNKSRLRTRLFPILVGASLLTVAMQSHAASTAFDYYGWFYAQYGLTSAPNDLALVAPYSNTGTNYDAIDNTCP